MGNLAVAAELEDMREPKECSDAKQIKSTELSRPFFPPTEVKLELPEGWHLQQRVCQAQPLLPLLILFSARQSQCSTSVFLDVSDT